MLLSVAAGVQSAAARQISAASAADDQTWSGRSVVCRRLHAIDLGQQQVELLSLSFLQLAASSHSKPIPEQALVMLVEPRPALQVVESVAGMCLVVGRGQDPPVDLLPR